MWLAQTIDLSWTVTDEDNSYSGYPWKYSYDLQISGTQGGLSHVVLETSELFNSSSYTGLSGNVTFHSTGLQQVTSGNPNMPQDVYGMRLQPSASGTVLSLQWSFFSNRQPVWGDFYARCGAVGGILNWAYNYNNTGGVENGFLSADTDPLAPASSGSLNYHLLVPDSVVPEPSSVALVTAVGLLGAAAIRKYRKTR